MVTRTCLADGCTNTFEVYPSKPKKYCSLPCRRRPTTNVSGNERSCAACGDAFVPASNRQQNCTRCVGSKADRARLQRYGVTGSQWQQMLARFDGRCWLCKEQPAEAVDHCHGTNRVRGALCRVCNMVLHYVERPGWWADAQAYLEGGDDHCA